MTRERNTRLDHWLRNPHSHCLNFRNPNIYVIRNAYTTKKEFLSIVLVYEKNIYHQTHLKKINAADIVGTVNRKYTKITA